MKKDWEHTYSTKGITQNDVLPTVALSMDILKAAGCIKILDLCCGTGRHLVFLTQAGFKVYGVDQAPSAIEITRLRLQKIGLKDIFLKVGDMRNLPYKDRLFDAVVCVWSTGHGHKEDMEKTISEMYRVLKPGGILLSDFPSSKDRRFGVGKEIANQTFLHPDIDHPDVPHYYFHEEELRELLSQYFEIVNLEHITYDDPKHMSKIKAFWVQAHTPK